MLKGRLIEQENGTYHVGLPDDLNDEEVHEAISDYLAELRYSGIDVTGSLWGQTLKLTFANAGAQLAFKYSAMEHDRDSICAVSFPKSSSLSREQWLGSIQDFLVETGLTYDVDVTVHGINVMFDNPASKIMFEHFAQTGFFEQEPRSSWSCKNAEIGPPAGPS